MSNIDLDSLSILSLAVIVGSALFMIAIERRYPYTPGLPVFRKDFFLDFFWYALAQSYVLGVVIGYLIDTTDGYLQVSERQILGEWPIWAQLLLFLVTHDLYIYFFHRWQHTNKALWRIHEAHHAPTEVDWLAGARSHPLEILINQTIEFAPMVLLGAHPAVPVLKGMISAVWGMWIHSNINVRTGPLQYIINGPEMHRWHHAQDMPKPAVNYGTKLAIWDKWFGTMYLPKVKPKAYGLFEEDERFPDGYFRQVFHAFRGSRRRVRALLSRRNPPKKSAKG